MVRAALSLAAAVGAAVVLLALVHDATRDRVTASERAHRAAAFDRVLGNASYDNDLLADRIEVRDPELLGTDASIPVYRARLAGQGAEVVTMTPPEQDGFFNTERARWAKVVAQAQIKLD